MRRISVILLCAGVGIGATLIAGAPHATVRHAVTARVAPASQLASTALFEADRRPCSASSKCSTGCWLPVSSGPIRPRGATDECAPSAQKPCMLMIAARAERPRSAPGGFCQSQGLHRVFRNLKPARPKSAPKPHR